MDFSELEISLSCEDFVSLTIKLVGLLKGDVTREVVNCTLNTVVVIPVNIIAMSLYYEIFLFIRGDIKLCLLGTLREPCLIDRVSHRTDVFEDLELSRQYGFTSRLTLYDAGPVHPDVLPLDLDDHIEVASIVILADTIALRSLRIIDYSGTKFPSVLHTIPIGDATLINVLLFSQNESESTVPAHAHAKSQIFFGAVEHGFNAFGLITGRLKLKAAKVIVQLELFLLALIGWKSIFKLDLFFVFWLLEPLDGAYSFFGHEPHAMGLVRVILHLALQCGVLVLTAQVLRVVQVYPCIIDLPYD